MPHIESLESSIQMFSLPNLWCLNLDRPFKHWVKEEWRFLRIENASKKMLTTQIPFYKDTQDSLKLSHTLYQNKNSFITFLEIPSYEPCSRCRLLEGFSAL